MHGPYGAPRRGTVVEFDDHRGLGTVEDEAVDGNAVSDDTLSDDTLSDDAARRYTFHCTAITGSRTIDVGAPVIFTPRPGRLGRFEAGDVTRVQGA